MQTIKNKKGGRHINADDKKTRREGRHINAEERKQTKRKWMSTPASQQYFYFKFVFMTLL